MVKMGMLGVKILVECCPSILTTLLPCSLQRLEAESTRVRQLEVQCSQLTQELAQSRANVQEGNYKIDNFDAVRRYVETCVVREWKQETLLPRCSYCLLMKLGSLKLVTLPFFRERDSLQSELDTLRQAMVEVEEASKASREEKEHARKEVLNIFSPALLPHDPLQLP